MDTPTDLAEDEEGGTLKWHSLAQLLNRGHISVLLQHKLLLYTLILLKDQKLLNYFAYACHIPILPLSINMHSELFRPANN